MNYLKKLLKNKSNLLTILVFAFIIFRQLPSWLNNFKWQGEEIPSKSYQLLNVDHEQKVNFPSSEGRSLAIFWASWCGPCKIEMNRLKSSVESGKIAADKIFAINPFEDHLEVRRFIQENNYPFNFIDAPLPNEKMSISLTPTTILFDRSKIESVTSGLSLIGIWRAEFFLN